MLAPTTSLPTLPGGASTEKTASWGDKATLVLLQETLGRECAFDSSTCDLEMTDRVVCLQGSVESVAQKLDIGRVALSVPGVAGVLNHLRVVPVSPHCDHRIATEVRAAFARVGLSAPLPEIKVVEGVVRLSGKVGTEEARKRAEDAAWSVPGVEFVVNETTAIITLPCSRQPAEEEKLHRDIQLALERSLGVEAKNVVVEVQGGIAHLRGSVSTERRRFLTETAVRWIPCIVDVVNDLTVVPVSSS